MNVHSHLRQPERVGERIAMASVLRAVERQHARAEHLSGREARIVDRERRRVAHHLDASARDVTTQASSSGIHDTGSRARSSASVSCRCEPSRSVVTAAPARTVRGGRPRRGQYRSIGGAGVQGCRAVGGLHDIVIIDADEVARLGDYVALVDALEAAHREPPAAVERIVYGPDGHAERLLALPAWQPDEAIGIKLVTVVPGQPVDQRAAVGAGARRALRRRERRAAGDDRRHRADVSQDRRRLGARVALSLASRLADVADGRRRRAGAAPHRRPSRGAPVDRPRRRVEPHAGQGARSWLPTVSPTPSRTISRSAAAAADIICTATLTKDPLISGEWLRPGTHLDCVGAYLPDHREIDDEVVRRAGSTSIRASPRSTEGGDLVIPIAAGVITASDVRADLYELSQGIASRAAPPTTTTRSRCSRTAAADTST